MLERICWFSILIGIEMLSLASLSAFTFAVLLWAGVLGGSF